MFPRRQVARTEEQRPCHYGVWRPRRIGRALAGAGTAAVSAREHDVSHREDVPQEEGDEMAWHMSQS